MGPEPGGEPGVEHVGILGPSLAGRFDLDARSFAAALRRIPDGDAVSPPELAADAPVLDVLEPVVVDLFPAFGEEPDESVADGVTGLDRLRILEEPLLAEAGFDRDIGALAEADVVLMGLLPDEEAEFLESLDGFHPRFEAVESGEALSRKVIECPVGIHDVDDGEVVPQADLVVGLVMGGCHLEDARAEFEIDSLVADDRELHLDIEWEGTADMLADQVGVALILGIHGDGRVTHDRLGTRGGDLKPGAGCFHHLEFEVVEVTLLLLGDDLLVA